MQMINRLTTILPLVDHQPKPIVQTLLFSNRLRGIKQVKVISRCRKRSYPGNLRPGYDDDMNGSLRHDIAKRNHVLILIDDVAGDLTIDDLCKQSRHTLILTNHIEQMLPITIV